MIVKKMPILKYFPDPGIVKNLTFPQLGQKGFSPLFYDIETTGLSRNSTFLYLIGAVVFEGEQWVLYQWLGETSEDEAEILKAFCDFSRNCSCTIQYNGDRFDQPYLEARCSLHQLQPPFSGKPSFDLYRELKPLKELLKLSGMRQPDLENFLGTCKREYCDGKECIRHYKNYALSGDSRDGKIILGHNEEDLRGLGRIFSMLGYLSLFQGSYQVERAGFNGRELLLTLSLPQPLPAEFSNGTRAFYITGHDRQAHLSVAAPQGQVRQYYRDYKSYDYLPGEDTAIPKALSAYMDRSLRISARPGTCYTWFDCTGDFLSRPTQQAQYLKHTLPYLLSTLKQVPNPPGRE